MPRARDYKAEYERRIARALAKGLSRSQGRGHPKPTEATIRPTKTLAEFGEALLQRGLSVLRQEKSLGKAAKAAHISPERLKHAALQRGAIEKRGRRWIVNPRLPRRMLLYSSGHPRPLVVTVGDFDTASLIGRYMAAVNTFLRSNDRNLLTPFVGQPVRDVNGTRHLFETNRNTLYRIASAGGETFEQVYRIVV
jgi:hypothetical protein